MPSDARRGCEEIFSKATSSVAATEVKFSNKQSLFGVPTTGHQGKHSFSDLVNSERPQILGFRILCSGRLQISSFSKPAEKAESIEITRGVLPLNSFQANIDFAQTYATNAYGTCGIKV